jgi:hypothetical protein
MVDSLGINYKQRKKMTKGKNGKVSSSLDVINADLLAVFAGVVNGSLVAELAAYEKGVSMLRGGQISVRGLKMTIEEAIESGSLPTIKPSTAQDFLLSAQVRDLEGGKNKSLKDLLNATIQGRKSFGGAKDFAKRIEAKEWKTFAELVKATPSQGERAKAGRKTSPVAVDVDSYVSLFMGATECVDFKVSNIEQWEKFINLVAKISDYNKRNHPAVRREKIGA